MGEMTMLRVPVQLAEDSIAARHDEPRVQCCTTRLVAHFTE